MAKPIGALNIVAFDKRDTICTSPSEEVRHLADSSGSPLQDFHDLLNHHELFLAWIESRHSKILELSAEVAALKNASAKPGPKGAKGETFEKYRWYAQQIALLEAINAFETFFKKTFVGLGEVLQEYIPPDQFKDSKLDARVLWSITDSLSIPALVFESQLFHDLEAVDNASYSLVRQRRYNQNNVKGALYERTRCLRAIFQIRHTLSHNNGKVTTSERSKLRVLKFKVEVDGVIDPSKDNFGVVIYRMLRTDSEEFSAWIKKATFDVLKKVATEDGIELPQKKRERLETLFGVDAEWDKLTWT